MPAQEEENVVSEPAVTNEEEEDNEEVFQVVDLEVALPSGKSIEIPSISVSESLNSIRQFFFELQETSFITSYHLNVRHGIDTDGSVVQLSADNVEYLELATYLQPNIKKCVIDLVYDDYDVKKVYAHVKRTREAITFPALGRTHVEEPQANAKDTLQQSKERIRALLPKAASITEYIDLGRFYQETLLRTGKADAPIKALSETIKSVTLSGWNPPPPNRKLQGDLAYLEVATASEGTFHITATPKGFYVNKCNRNHFDPAPSVPSAPVAHDLFAALLSVSATVRAAWAKVTKDTIRTITEENGPLDLIASLYAQGRGDQSSNTPQWNILSNGTFPAESSVSGAHTYDIYRAMDAASDMHGIEELGAPREWNDEIQALRSLAAGDVSDKVMKAKLEYKIMHEFTEACKIAAVAISDGQISPITYTDPVQSAIYVYNGIFFSKAEDNKDSFKICNGDEAFRKSTGRDLQNQKTIQAFGIEGLGTVLCAVVDYKGQRIIGQSIIPGIFTQGENSATLLYGILDKAKPINVQSSSYKMMEQIAKSLFLPSRTISATPFSHLVDEVPAEAAPAVQKDALNKLLGSLENEESSTIRVDNTDSMISEDGLTTPHIGPIEGKFLKGSDGRVYALEMMRLTPIDANYLQTEKGNKHIAAELLAKTDKDMSVAYVLRQELISVYLQRTIGMQRQELVAEAQKLEAALTAPEVKEGETPAEGAEPRKVSDEEKSRLATEFSAKYAAISAEAMKLELNPNVFLDFGIDVNPDVAQKDEDKARELATFLWEFVLPFVTKQVREGESVPKDANNLVDMLHRMGVNMRYLGQLARLAKENEDDDLKLLSNNKQRIQAMPQFWLEMLVVEIVARAAKHVLNGHYRSSKAVAAAPAQTIATFLNQLFSAISAKNNEDLLKSALNGAAPESKSAKKNKKKKAESAAADQAETDPAVTSVQDKALAHLADTIAARFCYNVSFSASAADSTNTADISLDFFRSRITSATLLRRICQVAGIRVATKSYDFASATPFSAEDIISLLPKTKSCEPDVLLPEFHEMLNQSNIALQQGNLPLAYEAAQQAQHIMVQITGPAHAHVTSASDQLTSVLLTAGDIGPATEHSFKRLALAVQLNGLDSSDSQQQHLQLSIMLQELKSAPQAIQHLLTAKYILELTGGPRHQELCTIYSRLASFYEEIGDYEGALTCLMQPKLLVNDLQKGCGYTTALAEFYFRRNRFTDAYSAQQSVYLFLKEMLPETDQNLIDCKQTLDLYLTEAKRAIIKAEVENKLKEKGAVLKASEVKAAVAAFTAAAENTTPSESDKKKKRHAHKKKSGSKIKKESEGDAAADAVSSDKQ